jgi:hypothetical protein
MTIQGPNVPNLRLPLAVPPRPAAPSREPREANAAAPEAASLWDLLTPEERTFFQQLATVGKLTYGMSTKSDDSANAAPIGQRIDVRG